MFSFSTSEFAAWANAPEKKFQNTKPQRTNKEYGRTPEGILANLPKKMVKIKVETKG